MDLIKVVLMPIAIVGVALLIMIVGQTQGGQWVTVSEQIALITAFLGLFGFIVMLIKEGR
jgi:hypothetical protein